MTNQELAKAWAEEVKEWYCLDEQEVRLAKAVLRGFGYSSMADAPNGYTLCLKKSGDYEYINYLSSPMLVEVVQECFERNLSLEILYQPYKGNKDAFYRVYLRSIIDQHQPAFMHDSSSPDQVAAEALILYLREERSNDK